MFSHISRIAISLLLLASFINATASISLGGNFQELPSGVTGICRATYNSPIKDCDAADFQDNNSCSEECVASLDHLANTLNTVCVGVAVDNRSLLGLVFQGKLVEAVCNPSAEISTSETTTSSTILSRSTSGVAKTTSDDTSGRTTTAAPSSSTSKAETIAKSTTDLGLDSSETTPTSTATLLATETVVSSTSTSSTATHTTTALTREQQQLEAKKDGGGGGNPFELSIQGGALRIGSSPISFIGALMVAVILIR